MDQKQGEIRYCNPTRVYVRRHTHTRKVNLNLLIFIFEKVLRFYLTLTESNIDLAQFAVCSV